ncbi:MAG: hypothetical protein KDA84_08530, partial [Planctomycetaceae bacterium]|nr:hypothetical protein [Planctomycetaceae bacterium]
MRPSFVSLFLAFLCAGILIPVFAEAPENLKQVPVKDLITEANQQIEDVKMWTASGDTYKEKEDDIRRTAGVLAVLGQAIQDHPEAKSQKISGMGLRDAALKLAKSKGPTDSVNAMKDIQAAQEGIPNMRKTFTARKDLIGMDDLMHVVNTLNAKLRRSARRSRDPEADSRNALVIAMLSRTMAEQGEDYLSEEAE